MACSDEDRGRSRRPDAEDRGRSRRPGTWRLEARVSWLSLKTKAVEGFPV
jgi:hypothetical protein